MMSQNRQDTKDRLRGELDFDVNRRAEREIQSVTHKLNLIDDKMGDVAELLRRHVALAGGNDSRPLSSLRAAVGASVVCQRDATSVKNSGG